jgi:phosphohistidine phosphatase SixA/SAM-dependent methyltransferase
MRHLCLLRSCKANADGTLDKQCQWAAEALAHYMQEHSVTPSLILCPSARRATNLLRLLAPALASAANIIEEDKIQTASGRDLLAYLRAIADDVHSLMLIGRSAALKELAARLTGSGQLALLHHLSVDFPPLGMALFELPDRPWRALRRADGRLVGFYGNGELKNLDNSYFDYYDGADSYKKTFEEYFDAKYVIDMIKTVWGALPPYSLLDAGSANGMTLAAFAKKGIDAWGIESSEYIHSQTQRKWRSKNLLGDVRQIPFNDKRFDFIYETCLCYVADSDVDQAISEMRRVTCRGVFFGSIVRDMERDYDSDWEDLFYGIKTLLTLEQWSDRFLRNGFRLAISNRQVMGKVWKLEKRANDGDPWYPKRKIMRYCFYTPC